MNKEYFGKTDGMHFVRFDSANSFLDISYKYDGAVIIVEILGGPSGFNYTEELPNLDHDIVIHAAGCDYHECLEYMEIEALSRPFEDEPELDDYCPAPEGPDLEGAW